MVVWVRVKDEDNDDDDDDADESSRKFPRGSSLSSHEATPKATSGLSHVTVDISASVALSSASCC